VTGRRAPIVAGGAAALLAIIAVMLLVLPKMGQVSEAQDELQAAQDQEIGLEVQLRALQEAQASAPETEREIALIEDQIPPTADLPALFRVLEEASQRAALDFFSFTPGAPVLSASGEFSTISSQIQVNGGYFAIDEFLFLLETLPRAAKVVSISLAPFQIQGDPSVGVSGGLNLQLQATVEFYTTDTSSGPGSIPGPTEGAATGATGA
jgi:Tfp pilus assembly protein PilO